MPTLAPFRRQLEAMLLIPPAQGREPARGTPVEPVVAIATAAEIAPAAVESPEVAVPTYLRNPGPDWAVAETIEAGSLPIPTDPLPFEPASNVSASRALNAAPVSPPERIPSGTLEAFSLPVPPERPTDVAATCLLGELPIPRDPLPFESGSASNDLRATMALGDLPIPIAKLPFERPAELTIEGLTLDAYAALCAALAARPELQEIAFAAHGLADPARRRAVGAAWQAHLAKDAEAMARWQDLYRRHVSR